MSHRTLTFKEMVNKSEALKAKIGPVKPLEEYPLPIVKPVKAGGNYGTIEPEDINPRVRIPVSRYH
jgi:hypothetical protein